MHNVPHAENSAPVRASAPALRSHFTETVGGAGGLLPWERGLADRAVEVVWPFRFVLALLIFTCTPVALQVYANWAIAVTARRSAADGRVEHVGVCANLF
jgi:hypothetical protein